MKTAEWVVERIASGELTRLAERFAPDVLVDLNVPRWRAQLQGRAAATEVIEEQFGSRPNLRTTWLRSTIAGDDVMLEYELRWDGPDGECLTRAAAAVRIVGDELAEYTEYCTGDWTPVDIARNHARAPMIRW